jgi:AraC-like DNA-binding protein
MQRRLAEYGVDFSMIVERTRFDAAVSMLDDRSRSVSDIAFELGYSDVSSFTRAFRRWSGTSPARFRKGSWPRI